MVEGSFISGLLASWAKSKALEADKSSPDSLGDNLKSQHCFRRNPTLDMILVVESSFMGRAFSSKKIKNSANLNH